MTALRRVFTLLGGLLVVFLAVGVLLPGEWSVERSALVEASPDSVHRVLRRPAAWRGWMPWPGSGAAFEGPPEGPGAAFSWDDPTYGAGRLTVTASDPPRSLAYRVSIEDGAFVVNGEIRLEPAGEGTRIRWSESGDFGWNPLLGWTALTVEDRQGRTLAETLARLGRALEGNEPLSTSSPAPARSGPDSTGPSS